MRTIIRVAITAPASFVIVTILAAVIEGLTSRYGLTDGLIDWVATALRIVSALVGSVWFAWLGGAILGVAAGIWLDAFARRLPPAGSVAAPLQWVTALDARAQFLPPKTEAMIAAAETAAAALKAKNDAQEALDCDQGNLQLIDALFDADGEWIDAEEHAGVLRFIARDRLVDQLADGSLIAKGLPKEGGVARVECAIPQEFWRFLNLDWTTDQATGEGHVYVGVRITRPLKA